MSEQRPGVLGECGATSPRVIGRCGRDVGHDGDHRSTGATFAASWAATHLDHTHTPSGDLVNDAEPLLVLTDAGTRRCEGAPWCGVLSRWVIEAVGGEALQTMGSAMGVTEPIPPVRYVCDGHALGAMKQLLDVHV